MEKEFRLRCSCSPECSMELSAGRIEQTQHIGLLIQYFPIMTEREIDLTKEQALQLGRLLVQWAEER